MRGWKTVEDQGVPWMKTRVLGGFVVVVWLEGFVGGVGRFGVGAVRREYFIVQLAWWKVEGRLLLLGGAAFALGRDMFSLFDSFGLGRSGLEEFNVVFSLSALVVVRREWTICLHFRWFEDEKVYIYTRSV